MFGIGWPTHRSNRSRGGLGWPHDDRSSVEPVVPSTPVEDGVADVEREVDLRVEEVVTEIDGDGGPHGMGGEPGADSQLDLAAVELASVEQGSAEQESGEQGSAEQGSVEQGAGEQGVGAGTQPAGGESTADPSLNPPPLAMADASRGGPGAWSRPLEWGSTAPHATEVQPWGQVIHVPSRHPRHGGAGDSVDDPLAQLGPSSEEHPSVPRPPVSRETPPVARETPLVSRETSGPVTSLATGGAATVAVIEHVGLPDGPSVTMDPADQLEQVEQVDLTVMGVERTSDHPGVVVGDDWRPPGAPLAPVMDRAETPPVTATTAAPSMTLSSSDTVTPASRDVPVHGARHLDPEQLDTQEVLDSLPAIDDSTPLAAEIAENTRRRISLSGSRFPHPPRTRVLTVANQKGGVGKTTTTVNVAAALAQSGLRVLVLDIDPQGNASTALGIDHHAEVPSLYDVVVEDMPLADVVQPCPDLPNLWCAPATIDLAGAEIELVSFVARETRLKNALDAYLRSRNEQGQEQIDYVLIDCPPSLSLLTVNAFVAAKEVLIPIQCEYYALEGLSQLLKHIDLIRKQLNPKLHVSTIMLTMYDGRTRLSAQVADEVRTHFPDQVVRTTVPRSVRISEAPSHGQTVMTYDPASSGALSYLEASRELAEQVLTWDSTKREEQL